MDEMEALLLNLEKEYNSNAELKAEISSSLLRLLLLQLARKVVTGDTMEQYRSDVLLVRDFINLIDTHFMSEKKVAAYARKLSIDPNYLNIKVKRITGHTASYHIQQRILLEAKHKMSSDGMNLKQIAYYLGYEDTSHFSKFFKKSEGATFTEFKNIV
jgi:AraC-like DNA-binding protein